jgi:hypothetical protein
MQTYVSYAKVAWQLAASAFETLLIAMHRFIAQTSPILPVCRCNRLLHACTNPAPSLPSPYAVTTAYGDQVLLLPFDANCSPQNTKHGQSNLLFY